MAGIAVFAAIFPLAVAVASAAAQPASLPAAPAGVQVTIDHGIEFVAIQGSLGRTTTPYHGVVGAVTPYRIGRTEITTAQWLPFLNAALDTGADWIQDATPGSWGAVPAANGHGWVLDPTLSQAGDIPIWDVTWRAAARYCNFLHNDCVTAAASFANGAYDTSTFGYSTEGWGLGVTDQVRHNADARYWIPTLDEWTTAAFSSPTPEGGQQWWNCAGASNNPPIPGAPGSGATTSSGYGAIGDPFRFIPVGAYPAGMSGWGLLDVSGGASEWLESLGTGTDPITGLPRYRQYIASRAGIGPWQGLDFIAGTGDLSPAFPSNGFRIAAQVPSPGSVTVVGLLLIRLFKDKR